MKIRSLLIINGVISVFLLFVIVGASWFSTHFSLLPSINESKSHVGVINLAGRQRMLSQKMSKEVELMVTGDYGAARGLLKTTLNEFKRALNMLEEGDASMNIPKPPNAEIRNKIEKTLTLWNPFHRSLKDLLEDPADKEALSFIRSNNLELLNLSNDFVQSWAEYSNIKTEQMVQVSKHAFLVQVVLFLISLISLVFLNYLLYHRIRTPIARTVDVVNMMAQGDLTERILIKRDDELGKLGSSINNTSTDLKNLVMRIHMESTSVSSIANTLYTLVGSIQEQYQEMSSRADGVSGSSDILLQSMNTMAAASEEFSSTVGSVASAMEQLNASVNEIAQNCVTEAQVANEAHEKVQGTKVVMDELGSAAGEINSIVEVISSIAAQTNLLALNATIEAASAGEAGKGFAVVANEVKELAKQSSVAASRIADQIGSIQTKTANSVTEIVEISDIIEQFNNIATTISSAVEEQSATVGEVSNMIGAFNETSRELSETIQNSAKQTEMVSSNIEEISQAMSASELGNEQSIAIAEKLIKVADEMEESIGHFNIGKNSFDLRQIKAAHLKWYGYIMETVFTKKTIEGINPSDDQNCEFGKWFFGEGKKLSGLDEYKVVEIEHREIHKIAALTIESAKNSNMKDTRESLKAFSSKWQSLFEGFDKLHQKTLLNK